MKKYLFLLLKFGLALCLWLFLAQDILLKNNLPWAALLLLILGQIGFYQLAKSVLHESRSSFAAMLFLLFSLPASWVLTQPAIALIYVQSVWFFYCFFRYSQTRKPVFLYVLTFLFAMTGANPMAFYFLTVLMFVLTTLFLVNFKHILGLFSEFKKKTLLFAICLVIISLALVRLGAGNILAHSFPAEALTSGGIAAHMSLAELYSYLDLAPFADPGFLYLPLFCYLLILCGAINRISAKITTLISLCFVFLLLSLGNTTPLYRWLGTVVPAFRFDQGTIFFLPYLAATLCLLAAEHLRLLFQRIEHAAGRQTRYALLGWIWFVHAGAWIFLVRQPGVPVYSLTAIILSAGFWATCFFRRAWLQPHLLSVLLALAILFHPAKFFWDYFSTSPNSLTSNALSNTK